MGKTITISKEDFQQWIDQLTEFFQRLSTDEIISVSAIGVGLLLFLVGLLML